MTYYPIDEQAARRAKEANSFSAYQSGSRTAEYQAMVNNAYDMAEKTKASIDPIHYAKVDALLDRYARKLAKNLNDRSSIDARVPSILITGGGNFPVRRKEKQNTARDRNMAEYIEIEKILDKLRGIGKGGISSDDPEARSKLEQKITKLEQRQETMKAANAYYRKHKTLENCPHLTVQEIEQLQEHMNESYHLENKPYRSFELSNNSAEIRRLKARLHRMKQNKSGDGWEFEGGKVEANAEVNRLQIHFDEKPSREEIQALKSRGFKWAPSQGVWQRQLTANAIYSAKTLEFIQP